MKFEPKALDYDLSPYTGLTRESWLEAGKYMLEGIFRNIDDFREPVVMPRKETEITYPHLKASPETQAIQRTAEVFEGLTRSFFIAAPLLANLPALEICGYSMAEYYKSQVLRVCTKGDPLYVGTYEDQQSISGHTDPFRTFQQTVETCALVICLWVSRAQIWDTYTKEEKDVVAGFMESQQYVLRDGTSYPRGKAVPDAGRKGRANVTFWHGRKDGILYRRQFFDYSLETESHWIQAVNLADFAVPYGIMRVDKLRLHRAPVSLTLGSYGFPDNGTEISEKSCGAARAVILKGTDATGREKQMAMTIYDGWKKLNVLHSTGTNPDSDKSVMLYASMKRKKQYGGFEPYVLISQVITKESHKDFTEEELFPIAEVIYADPEGCGSCGPVTLRMKDGSVRTVEYEGMEGCLML